MAIPTDFAGLVVWHEAASQPEASGDPVATLVGVGGTANSQTQATTSWRPTLVTRTDGAKALRFDGSDDRIAFAAASAINARPLTTFVVFSSLFPETAAAGKRVLAGSNNWLMGTRTDGGTGDSLIRNKVYVGTWIAGTEVFGFLATHCLRQKSAADAEYRIDGVLQGTTTGTTAPGVTGIGAHTWGEPAFADVIAVVQYNVALADADMAAIEVYLATLIPTPAPPPLRETQEVFETLASSGTGLLRETQEVFETLAASSPVNLVETQEVWETLAAANPAKLRYTQMVFETLVRYGRPSGVGFDPLVLDCTIQGIINQAMLDSGINVAEVTTRGALGSDIVQHRAALLAHLAAVWEGVEVGDIESPVMSPISLVDIGEIVMVEARRTSDQKWFRVPLVPMTNQ